MQLTKVSCNQNQISILEQQTNKSQLVRTSLPSITTITFSRTALKALGIKNITVHRTDVGIDTSTDTKIAKWLQNATKLFSFFFFVCYRHQNLSFVFIFVYKFFPFHNSYGNSFFFFFFKLFTRNISSSYIYTWWFLFHFASLN